MSVSGNVAVGHPVDVASGAVFTEMVDAIFEGTIPMGWRRHYSTDLGFDSWLGRNWTVTWFASLTRVDDGYELRDESGRLLRFVVDPSTDLVAGGSVMSYGANMELYRRGDRFVIDHWHHGTDDVERFCFLAADTGPMPLAWLENVSGHRVVVEHDGSGRPIALIQEIEQRRLEVSYGRNSLIESLAHILDDGSRKQLVRYEYDAQRRLTAAFDATGHRTSYDYDDAHRLVRETNVLGSSFVFHYDEEGRCVQTYGDGGYLERKLVYSSAPPSTRVTDSEALSTIYYLNAAGQVIQQVSPLGAVATTTYDEYGRPVEILDSMGGMQKYEYDIGGNRSAVLHADGARSEMHYNAYHLLTEYVAPSGAVWTYSYNDRGEVVALTTPTGSMYTAVRDDRGLVVETRMPSGRTLRFTYGPRLRWVEVADQLSLITRTEFDVSGNQTAIFDAEGLVQRATFDVMNRPVVLDDEQGRTYRVEWNPLGEWTELRGPGIPWQRRAFDRMGQLVETSNPLGSMRAAYDLEGRLVSVTDRVGNVLTRHYDAEGRIASETAFDGRTEHYSYEGHSLIHTRADGRVVVTKYGSTGVRVSREADGDTSEFFYDADCRLIGARNSAASLALERDADGRVIAEVQNGRRVEYQHDGDGDRIARRITGFLGGELEFQRDARKRLIGVNDARGVCVELKWDDVDRLVECRHAGSVTERVGYDSRRRVTQQSIQAIGGVGLLERRYAYDSADNVVERIESGEPPSTFRYDDISRLVEVVQASRTEIYNYDANGSIVSTHTGTRTIEAGGATLRETNRRYWRAADGSVERIEEPGGDAVLAHNVDGQIAAARLPDGRMATYGYDPLGRRVYKAVDGIRTDFLWEGPVLAAEFERDGAVRAHFFFAFEPLAQWSHDVRLTPITDVSGMVREVFDEHGRAVWRGSFDAYGANITERGSIPQLFRFRGQYLDAETGLHHNFNRYYDPRIAEYSAPDPIGVDGGANYYAYPRNPLLWDDPFGLSCSPAHSAEQSMDGFFGQKGYKKIGARGKPTSANGIDAVYYKKGGKPPYIIAEAKSGGASLGKDQHGNQQMSDAWINGRPADRGQPRLDGAFPPGSKWPDRIDAAAEKGNVGKVVYNPDHGEPKVQQTGSYGGRDSNSTTF